MGISDSERNKLTEKQRAVLALRDRNFTYRQISTEFGVSVDTVKDHLDAIKKKLHLVGRHLEPLKGETAIERVVTKSAEFTENLSEGRNSATIRLCEQKVVEALTLLDRQTMANESARGLKDIAVGLTNVKQLLSGEPTSITRFEDMRKLDEFLEQASEELKRRGEGPEVIDVTPEEG